MRGNSGPSESDEEKVDKDVMDWVTARRETQPRTQGHMVQIFVKVYGFKDFLMDVSLTDKVSDTVRRIPNSDCKSRLDMYVTCKGRVLRWSDELRSFGVSDGCTLHVLNRMCGGGNHVNKSKAEINRRESKEPRTQCEVNRSTMSRLLSRENDKDAVIRHSEETEGSRKIIADLAEGNNSDMKKRIQTYTELMELDDEQRRRQPIEARRKDTEPTAAQEQGKKVFCTEEKEGQEAREWQDKIGRAREAHAEKWREQEKKRYEEDEGVPVMEAGCSYFHRPKRRC